MTGNMLGRQGDRLVLVSLEQADVLDHHVVALPRVAVEDQQNAEVQVVEVRLLDNATEVGDNGGVRLVHLLDIIFEADLRAVVWIRPVKDASTYALRAVVESICSSDG